MVKHFSFLLLFLSSCCYAEFIPIENIHYKKFNNISSKNELVVISSYECIICYKHYKLVHQIGDKYNIKIKNYPLPLDSNFTYLLKIHYAAYYANIIEKIRPVLYQTGIKKDPPYLSIKDYQSLFQQYNIDKQKYNQLINHPLLQLHIIEGESYIKNFKSNSIPAYIVNNKYLIMPIVFSSKNKLKKTIEHLLQLH